MNYYDEIHPVYDQNGQQVSNWDPNDKGGYFEVYFRIDTKGFDCMNGTFENPEDREAFYKEAHDFLNLYGIEENSGYNPHNPEYLYIHPQNISGVIHSSKIKVWARYLDRTSETFSVRCVSVYHYVHDIPDFLYREYLNRQSAGVEDYITTSLKTKRSNLYIVLNGIFSPIYKTAETQFGIRRCAYLRPGCTSHDPVFAQYWHDTIDKLIAEGRLVTAETKNGTGIRTATQKRTSAKKGA